MTQQRVYVYVQDTWSDWEAGYTMAELNSGRFFKNKEEQLPVKTVGLTKDPITTMGGVSITPDLTLRAVTVESSAMLILVGGDTWQDPKHQPIVEKAKNCSTPVLVSRRFAAPQVHLPKLSYLIIDPTPVMESNISRRSHRTIRGTSTTKMIGQCQMII